MVEDKKKKYSFQIASDFHIEYKSDPSWVPNPLDYITPVSDVLILAGDVGSLYKFHQLKSFLREVAKHFKIVLYIPGNHEFYVNPDVRERCTFEELTERVSEIGRYIPNLHVINRSSVRIGDVCIAGCTLWSRPEIEIPRYIVRIHDFDTQKYKALYEKDLRYIVKMIKYCRAENLKLVVVTHHCPTAQVLTGSSKKEKFKSLYVSDMDYLLKKENVHTWVCGHIHHNFDFITPAGTRVVGNQVGKPKDDIRDYSKKFLVDM